MSEASDVHAEAVSIANDMKEILTGHSTASVYIAIGMILGRMETHTGAQNRESLFAIIGTGMDIAVKANKTDH